MNWSLPYGNFFARYNASSVLGNTLRASLNGACGLKAHLVALWRGDVPLGQAFWEYAIAYGTIANIVATAAAIVTVAAGLPETLAICLFLMPLPYILIAVVAVCAERRQISGGACESYHGQNCCDLVGCRYGLPLANMGFGTGASDRSRGRLSTRGCSCPSPSALNDRV